MPGVPEFEYHFRWNDVLDNGLTQAAVFQLEARDQALELHLRSFGGSCSIQFEFPYRWDQILQQDEVTQIVMLDSRDTALEAAIRASGGCRLEFPYRWTTIWPAMLAGDADGAMWAEENDRTIESRFAHCSCGVGLTGTGPCISPEDESVIFSEIFDPVTITNIHITGTNINPLNLPEIYGTVRVRDNTSAVVVNTYHITHFYTSLDINIPVSVFFPFGAVFEIAVLDNVAADDMTITLTVSTGTSQTYSWFYT